MNTKAYDGSGENSMVRTDKENYYLDIAETVLERGTCLRRNYGAIIVCNDEIVSTGYNGAPRGRAAGRRGAGPGYCITKGPFFSKGNSGGRKSPLWGKLRAQSAQKAEKGEGARCPLPGCVRF